MCNNVYEPPYPVVVAQDGSQTIVGCAPDLQTVEDQEGYYTYVISHVSDRPSDAVLAANAATWLPFSTKQPEARHILALRNLIGVNFPHSVQQCAQGFDPNALAQCRSVMGAYYPEAAECVARFFEVYGAEACFRNYQLERRRAGVSEVPWPENGN